MAASYHVPSIRRTNAAQIKCGDRDWQPDPLRLAKPTRDAIIPYSGERLRL